jgi:oxalate decarboxylase/phosphoglucose isomerase-like protein (cupin superfamily)
MEAQGFSIEALREAAKEAPDGWVQYLRLADLRSGVYRLEAGAEDPQTPHAEDEIYFALAGRAELVIETSHGVQVLPVQKGSLLYVAKNLPHRFRDIRERLELLVFFASSHSKTAG